MAAQSTNDEAVKWNAGSLCELYDRDHRKWKSGEIVGSFSDEHGQWIKVRCGQEIVDVVSGDPDLRMRQKDTVTFAIDKIKALQRVNVGTNADSILQWVLQPVARQLSDHNSR